jgi:hypothetical protein
MRRRNDFRYEVTPGEEITLVFNLFGGIRPSMVAAALDSGPIEPDPPRPSPTYRFRAEFPPGETHFFKVECSFVAPSTTERVDVEVTGEEPDGTVSGPFTFTIAEEDSIHDPTIRFRVVDPS